jgi:transposase InsO family protein
MAQRRAEGWPVSEIADAAGVSKRTVYKWLARSSAENRSSRARRIANRAPDRLIEEMARLRRQRLTGAAIARRLKLARSTVAGWLNRLGLGRLKLLEPKPPIQRYEREKPGELIHVDTKKLGRFNKIGHRIRGDIGRRNRNHQSGWDFVHVAIDDASRLAYVEVLDDETGLTACSFLARAIAWYRSQKITVERVMSDNGSPYVSKTFRALMQQQGLRHLRTRPYTPRTNRKAERFIQTLLREWAYAKPYNTSGRRNAALSPFVSRYNYRRPHASLGGRSPADALQLKR